MHGVIPWCQAYHPFAIGNEDLVVVTSWALLDAAVDVLHLHDVIGDGLFICSTQVQRNPYMVLLAVHLFVGGLESLGAVTKDTCLIATHLYLAAHNDHGILHP